MTLSEASPLWKNTIRDRVKLMLNGVAIQTEYTDHTMCFAAHYLLRLAQSIWQANPHPVTHAIQGSPSVSRKI